jgi:NAD(P)-dependent dehydrogenase (short-subunit alcohol dehydrogenase family)
MNLSPCNAVVIGGASGIGEGICRALARAGATVDVCDRDTDGAQAVATALRKSGLASTSHSLDVTDENSIKETEVRIRAARGRIDLLFANAGVIALKPFLEAEVKDFQWVMDINFFGCVRSVRAFLPGMLGQDSRSRILITSSVAALRTPEMIGQTMYMASKAAQLGFSNALRRELAGTKVDLSVIFPGPVATQLMQKSERDRPGSIRLEVPQAVLGAGPMGPEEAGERIVAAVAQDKPFIATHAGERNLIRAAQDHILAAFDAS